MKTNIENATARPWEVIGKSQVKLQINAIVPETKYCPEGSRIVCEIEAPIGGSEFLNFNASAALIVQAVNQFDALKKVAEAAASTMRVLETYKDYHGSWQQINYLNLKKAIAALDSNEAK